MQRLLCFAKENMPTNINSNPDLIKSHSEAVRGDLIWKQAYVY